ncbi:NnrS family protein [Methylomonas sp. MED-D]|uniref:Short-chain dehydrogenase n=1 Tax=Methylomonas koyamae TaxID=702114 RepID=A0A177N037_9GAMM|nr:MULTISPECIES: NnrS family protein [Methylomonas]MDT4328589.1 NnrS family protein [Methylomonas sp. MV1]OAI11327.1 short-chain dehydrogenase [Methylomonas koyamae]
MNNKPVFDYPLFAMGFRAFFALAGLSALALIGLWNAMSNGNLHVDHYFPGTLWHAHEMLLGYTSAVIAGFLLTAVANWTSRQTVSPDQLASLSFLWLYGRVLPFYSEWLPDVLIAAVDWSFLPALTYFVARPILQTRQYQHGVFVALLLLMALANAWIHGEVLGWSVAGAARGLNLMAGLVVVMILVIAGRVFPFFTERGLSGVICIRSPALDIAAILAGAAVFLLLLIGVSGLFLAAAAFAAAVLSLLRVGGWYNPRIWYVPLLWVLYIGYAWVIVGFVLVALSAFEWVAPALALHAFTVGGIGILTLGMMARVALGHTGRALKASNVIAIAFIAVNLAALFRVLVPALVPTWYGGLVMASAYCWLAAFSLFAFYYAPILTAPRLDGQPG